MATTPKKKNRAATATHRPATRRRRFRHDGSASWVVHVDGDPLPDGACAQLDPEVTA